MHTVINKQQSELLYFTQTRKQAFNVKQLFRVIHLEIYVKKTTVLNTLVMMTMTSDVENSKN